MYTANTKEEAYDYYEGFSHQILINDPSEEVWFRFSPLTYGTSHYRVYTSGMISAQCEITDGNDQFINEEVDIDQTLPMLYDNVYYFKLMSYGTQTGSFDFQIEGLPLYGMDQYTPVEVNDYFSDYLAEPGDSAWIRIYTESDDTYTITVNGAGPIRGDLYGAVGNWISAECVAAGNSFTIEKELASFDYYYLKIYPQSLQTGYFEGQITITNTDQPEEPEEPEEPTGPEITPDENDKPVNTNPDLPANLVDDPIDVSTGSQKIELTPFHLFGGESLAFSIYYDSSNLAKGSLGVGWYHKYEKHLVIDGAVARVYEHPGHYLAFVSLEPEGDTLTDQYDCIAPGKTHYHLSDTGNGYCLTRGDEGYEYYEAPDENGYARLVKVETSHGAEIVIQYSSWEDENYIDIIDPKTGQKIAIVLDSSGKINFMDDALNPIGCSFDYTGDFLTGVSGGPGCPLRYTYSSDGRILTGTDGTNVCYFENTYDSYGWIIRQEDGRGNYSTYEYYPDQGIARSDAEAEGITEFTYHPTSVTITDRAGNKSYRYYDSNGLLTREVNERQAEKFYEYDTSLNITRIVDFGGAETETIYNNKRMPTRITDPRGLVIQKEYNFNCHPTRIVYDDGGEETIQETFEYDNAFGPKKHTSVDGLVTQYTYNNKGQLLTKKEGDRPAITYAYTNGLLTSETDARSNVTRYEYNEINQMVKKIDALNRITRYEYDDLGNLLKVTDPAGKETRYTYDCNGKMLTQVDALGNTTEYSYDGNMNLLRKTFPNQSNVSYQYDAMDRLNRVVDQLDNVTRFEYDSVGNLTKKILPDGGIYTYEYNDAGFLTKETDPLGNVTQKTYNAKGDVLTVTDAAGTTTYTYDKFGRILTKTDPMNGQTTYTYSKGGKLLSETDALNHTTAYGYDVYGNLITKTDALNYVTRYEYDANNNLTKEIDSTGAVTAYEYDSCNQLVKKVNPLGGVETYDYDLCGRKSSVTNVHGTVLYNYDDAGRLISTVDANNNITTYEYDVCGNLIKVTDALNGVMTHTYDACNRLEKTIDSRENSVQYSYDACGRRTAIQDPSGNTFTTVYDLKGNVLRQIDAKQNVVSQKAYNLWGQPAASVDANGSFTYTYNALGKLIREYEAGDDAEKVFAYDAVGRLTSVTDELGGLSTLTYDALGRVTRIQGPGGAKTDYTYDAMGRVLTESTPSGGTVHYTYNGLGQVTKKTNARGQEMVYTYDNTGRLTCYTSPDETLTYTYDNNGNLLTVSNGTKSIVRTYDALNRVTSYKDYHNKTVGYEYDANGNLTRLIYPDNTAVIYTYDDCNRMKTVTDWCNHETVYTYDANGNVIRSRNWGSYTNKAYDEKQRLTEMKTYSAEDEYLYNGYEYTYGPKSRIMEEKDIANNRKLCYTYDKSGRVLNRNVIDLTTDELLEEECESFSYDAAGNVLLPGYSYDSNNRLVTFNSDIEEPVSYAYDADGNMIMEDHEWGSGHDCYSYDAKNRLKAKQAFWDNYVYDAEGLLCVEGEGDALGDVLLTYNPHARLSQLLMAEGGVETVKFVYGLGLISHSKWSTSRFNEDNIEFPDENRYYHYDYRGSATLLMTEDGMPCDRFNYSTYGACSGNGRPIFNYNGRDGVMWGSYMRNRFYMGNGRFYNADILTGTITHSPSLNRYAYAEGNPVTNVDPLGLSAERGSMASQSWRDMDRADWYDLFLTKITDGIKKDPLLLSMLMNNPLALLTSRMWSPYLIDLLTEAAVDLAYFDINNQSEQAVLDAKLISAYKGKLVLKVPFPNEAASFGIMFIGNGEKEGKSNSAVDVKHEYGHTIQFDQLGIVDYTRYVAIPSVKGYWNDVKNYYSQPWEYIADRYGGVLESERQREIDGKTVGGYTDDAEENAQKYWRKVAPGYSF